MSKIKWDDFYQFSRYTDKYLPDYGEGETKATQTSTALNKLVYKWFNDGDVFDNTHILQGWANNISDEANWIYHNIPGADVILERISTIYSKEGYTELLYDLCKLIAIPEFLEELDKEPKIGTVYNCDGPYEFLEPCPECGSIHCDGECQDYCPECGHRWDRCRCQEDEDYE